MGTFRLSGRVSEWLAGPQPDLEKTNLTGWLIGVHLPDQVVVVSGIDTALDDLVEDLGYVNGLLPPGLHVVGAYFSPDSSSDKQNRIVRLLPDSLWSEEGNSSNLPILLAAGKQFWLADRRRCVTSTETDQTEIGLAGFVQLHMRFIANLQVYSRQSPPAEAAVTAAFGSLREDLCSSSAVFVAGISEQGHLLTTTEPIEDVPGGTAPLSVTCLTRQTPLLNSSSQCIATAVQWQPCEGGPMQLQSASLELEVLAYACSSTPQDACARLMKAGIRRQLQAMQASVNACGIVQPQCARHFQPDCLPHCLSVVYPIAATGSEDTPALKQQRLSLHKRLRLPEDRPLFRLANAVTFDRQDGAASTSGRLQNVHVGIAPSGIPRGQEHLIWGGYEYHHYMQDKFDDSGWGCAYRSLQTIWSWMRHQHYASAPVPTHRQIQQTLADIGDKPRNFVGSKQWIGAIELGYVLDTHLGIACKILTVSSGADIESKARQLAQHFDEQGTPVMIGGGVLAYTLLGVQFNPDTGECAFLILDPHYTGSDNLAKIQQGQWVAWKRLGGSAAAGGDLFRSDSFYNLLCPQRPQLV